MLTGVCDVTSFSPCTHELQDLQHFISEQIDLHVFKAITAASCVDIIVNKPLTGLGEVKFFWSGRLQG